METHLGVLDNVNIPGYVWLGNNRKFVNSRAPKPSGSVGVLFKEQLLCIIDKQFDGILAIEIKNRFTDFICVVFVCYLSPKNSVWEKDMSNYFVNILSLLYVCSFADLIVLCGDFNARIGKI